MAWRSWDQWQAFTVGNTALGLVLLIYATLSGLLAAVWGQVTLWWLGQSGFRTVSTSFR